MANDNTLANVDNTLADGETQYIGFDSGLPDQGIEPLPSTQVGFGHQAAGRAFIALVAIPFVALCMVKERGGLRERLMAGLGAGQHLHAAWTGGPLG